MNDSTMKFAGQLSNPDLLAKLYQGETKREQQSKLSPEKARLIQTGLDKLVSYGLLSDPEAIRDWANGIADIDEHGLIEGFRKAKDKTGYMTLGDFRALCKRPVMAACHRPFVALECKPMEREAMRAKIKEMRERIGI